MTHEANDQVGDGMEREKGSARERAGQLKATLADKLETGAGKLRERTSDAAKLADAIAVRKDKVADASDRVATRMEHTADLLRDTDMSKIQRGIEKHVKENPGRTLLIAAGIGFLIGRALKGRES
jgi:ElaB/YqjD/DUF883 family membrane-anchored ribosome-binding protein